MFTNIRPALFLLTIISSYTTAALAYHPVPPVYCNKPKCIVKKTVIDKRCINRTLRDGFYLGVGVGYDDFQVDQTTQLFQSKSGQYAAPGPSGSIFGGYGQYYDWFYYGGEVTITGSGASLNSTLTSESPVGRTQYRTKFSVRESYEASLLAGGRLSRFALLYLRLGVLRSYVSVDERLDVPLFGVAAKDLGDLAFNGIKYGVGIEAGIFNNVSLRAEYTRAAYEENKTERFKTNFTPHLSQFMLSLIYHFCY